MRISFVVVERGERAGRALPPALLFFRARPAEQANEARRDEMPLMWQVGEDTISIIVGGLLSR